MYLLRTWAVFHAWMIRARARWNNNMVKDANLQFAIGGGGWVMPMFWVKCNSHSYHGTHVHWCPMLLEMENEINKKTQIWDQILMLQHNNKSLSNLDIFGPTKRAGLSQKVPRMDSTWNYIQLALRVQMYTQLRRRFSGIWGSHVGIAVQ